MKQISLATTGFELVTKRTRKREFLGEMNLAVPWAELVALITSYAPSGKARRPPVAVATMLRIHLHSNSGSACLTRPWKRPCKTCRCTASSPDWGAGITRLPDESTILRFRHLLEVELTRFHRHISASSTKLLECQRAQIKMTVPADSIVETLDVIEHV